MTLIVDILARAARQCSVPAPSSWVAYGKAEVEEMRDFLSETVGDIQERFDVAGPLGKSVTITGDGGEVYALPSDFKRMARDGLAVYERYRSRRACLPVSTSGDWEYLKELGAAGADRYYRVQGYEGNYTISFYRPLEAGLSAVVSYVSTNWVVNGATEKPEFSLGDDVSMLPREILETGIVWRFRERKGLEFTDKQAEYEAKLARWVNDTRGLRVISFGATNGRGPFDVPVPDFIPSGA